MRRYWKRWVGLLLFVLVLGTAFILLGRWQLDRLAERKQSNAIVVAHENAAPVAFSTQFQGTVTNDQQWQRVEVTGTYDDSQTIRIRYRTNDGKSSAEFVTPLHASDGRTVLVDRGYALVVSGQEPTAPAAPTGTVTVTGYVRRDEQGPANARVPQDHQARLIDAAAIGTTLPYSIVDGYLSLSQDTEPTLTAVPTPTLDEGPHLSYALQWFSFCAMAVVGLFVFIRGDIRQERKARERAARAAATPAPGQDSDTPQAAAPPERAAAEAANGAAGEDGARAHETAPAAGGDGAQPTNPSEDDTGVQPTNPSEDDTGVQPTNPKADGT